MALVRMISVEADVNVAKSGKPDNRYRVLFRYGDNAGAIDIPIFVEAAVDDAEVVKVARQYLAEFAMTLSKETVGWAAQGVA